MKARFTSVAELELSEAMLNYEAARQGLGASFLRAVQAATHLIELHPQAWTPVSPRTRRIRTHRFPFGLFYQIRSDELLIVAVMDLRRNPKRWERYL